MAFNWSNTGQNLKRLKTGDSEGQTVWIMPFGEKCTLIRKSLTVSSNKLNSWGILIRHIIILQRSRHVHCEVVKSLSHVQLFVTLWTVARQATLSMKFSRQEYWSGLPFPSPISLYPQNKKPKQNHKNTCRDKDCWNWWFRVSWRYLLIQFVYEKSRKSQKVYTQSQRYVATKPVFSQRGSQSL